MNIEKKKKKSYYCSQQKYQKHCLIQYAKLKKYCSYNNMQTHND